LQNAKTKLALPSLAEVLAHNRAKKDATTPGGVVSRGVKAAMPRDAFGTRKPALMRQATTQAHDDLERPSARRKQPSSRIVNDEGDIFKQAQEERARAVKQFDERDWEMKHDNYETYDGSEFYKQQEHWEKVEALKQERIKKRELEKLYRRQIKKQRLEALILFQIQNQWNRLPYLGEIEG